MRRLMTMLILVAALAIPAATQTTFSAYHGWCEQGGQKVSLSGLLSVTTVQQSFPACNVTVYLHSTTTAAAIYSDAGTTPLANPFTATSQGQITFYADASQRYDIVEQSGTGINVFPAPFTLFDVQLGGGAGGGGGGGGGTPGGSTNDIQSNNGGGGFAGTGGLFQWNPTTHNVTLSGSGGLLITSAFIDFSGVPKTIPNFVGTASTIAGVSCGAGWTAIASDLPNGANYLTCGSDNQFHVLTGTLPAAPGTSGQFIMNIGGSYSTVTGLYQDVSANVTHFPGGGSFDSTNPFSISGTCPASTPLGASSVGTALIGWDVGCIPKISFNASTPATIGLQGYIDYTYLKLDANNCFAIGPTTGDVGWARFNTGVLSLMNCANTTSPTRLNVVGTFTSSTNYEVATIEWDQVFNSWFIGSAVGSLSGSQHPVLFGANGPSNPQWGLQVTGPLTCQTQNLNCDIGSITSTQQVRNIWQAGFLAESIIGDVYPVNSSGVQVGLVAARASTSPVQAVTATVAQTTGAIGIVAFLSNGTVSGSKIVSGGSGYTGPTCAVSLPTVNSGTQATCTAHQTAGVIDTVTITNTGSNSGYQSIQATTITISDANGTGASILPVLTATAGFAGIAQQGSTLSPIFDGNTTAKDRVALSTTVAGELHDTGIACSAPVPASIQTFGCVEATSSAGAGASVLMSANKIDADSFILLGAVPSGTTCPTAGSVGATCKDTITLSPAMPDANYVAVCNIASVTSGVPTIISALTADRAAGSFKISVAALTASAAQAATYDCTVRHQ